jgi:hypothetical protein
MITTTTETTTPALPATTMMTTTTTMTIMTIIPTYRARESDFGTVLEDLPALGGCVERGDEDPVMRVVLAEQAIEFTMPHQFHPETHEQIN